MARISWAIAPILALALGCVGNEANQVTPPVVIALASTTAPLVPAAGEAGALYQVGTPMKLPVRRPTDAEASALAAKGEQSPYPRAPFLRAGDVRLTLRWTLTNLDDARHAVELLLDPWNEFARYRPGVSQDAENEEAIPNFSGFQRSIVLEPKQRLEGVLTPDDMRELSVDLATAMVLAEETPPNAGALMNHAMNLQNRSSAPAPVIAPFVPRLVAGLTGFDLGLRARESMNVALEVTVDIVDAKGDRVVAPDSKKPTFDAPGRVIQPAPAPGG